MNIDGFMQKLDDLSLQLDALSNGDSELDSDLARLLGKSTPWQGRVYSLILQATHEISDEIYGYQIILQAIFRYFSFKINFQILMTKL